MSRIASAIIEEANYQAQRLQDATPALNAQLRQLGHEQAELERRQMQIKTQLEAARLAQKRLLNFQPSIGADFQCPRCLIVNEIRSFVRPIGSNTSDDIMRCGLCGLDLIIPGR